MQLGAFSISLAVQDLETSRAFYEKLGFEEAGGDGEHYLMLRNAEGRVLGLFQGLFERNILTFNPGWSQEAEELDDFLDVRAIRDRLVAAGLELSRDLEHGEDGVGPDALVLEDPDGNPILVDQHVPKPGAE